MRRCSGAATGLLAIALAATLTACGGGSGGSSRAATAGTETSASPSPRVVVPNAGQSCTIIVGSGAIKDIATVFDKYKGNSNPFTTADATAMRDALDRLAHAGDNASPKIREAVVKLVADAGSLIDSRAKLEGVGKVASVHTIQEELGALCH